MRHEPVIERASHFREKYFNKFSAYTDFRAGVQENAIPETMTPKIMLDLCHMFSENNKVYRNRIHHFRVGVGGI